jgi:predicted dehydrogenase
MEPSSTNPSRRSFVKKSIFAGAAFSIVPRAVLGGRGYIPPSDTLYIAGIGVGGKGHTDLTSFAKHKQVKVAYLCDVDDQRAARSVRKFGKAQYYRDYRKMFDQVSDDIDAVSVSTPDHNHAVQTMAAMQRGKHVYVQKPLTHDIYEARMLAEAARKYKVVTQMGNQGASGEGVRVMKEWYEDGQIGEVKEVFVWTDRPVWPQGIAWPTTQITVPQHLDWDLWLGTAPDKGYIDKLVPFNWRGWWDYGTGALGDMGCHLIEPAFSVLGLGYPTAVQASVGSVYVDEFQRGYFPDSCPPSSHVIFDFEINGQEIKLHWMDGGIQPMRPDELGANEIMGDGGNGMLMIGSKGKMMCGTYGANPKLLPTEKTETVTVAQKYDRVPEGHYLQWVNACLSGYGQKECSSDFSIAGPLTETILMGNLAIRSHDIRFSSSGNRFKYPGRNIKLLWDGEAMKVTNFDDANEFVRRTYRKGWKLEG